MFKSVLLVGATGGLGQYVAQELLNNRESFSRVGFYHNTARPTDESKAALLKTLQDGGIEIIAADGYANPNPYKGFECVMIFLGNHGLHLQPTIIDAAIEAGVRHFYPSEYGADVTAGQNWTQRYYKYKVITREHLEQRGKEVPDLGWTLFLLGRLTEWAAIRHFGFDNKNASARIYGTSSGRQSLINVEDTAQYLVATLQDAFASGENAHRRTYRISGSTVTYGEIFDILQRVTGRKYEVTYLHVEDALVEEAEAKARGDIDAELAASHKLIQGREGTLLPQPWNNDRFPHLHPKGVEESLRSAFGAEKFRKFLGLS